MRQEAKVENVLANPFLSFKQAVEYLGNIPESTLREWTSTRKITSYRPGKQVRYRKSDLDEFMELHIKKSYHMIKYELTQKA
ncbi:helix-turn-helix domain-containing protein [Pontibacter litorisediminis]|uniref:helix-turn-helix domain-containing protein n=1 Tax=Pontibacter litorisediminis TaxID=1846260 RepID=UPI0023EC4E61|nr:helix-turn-helix domain-containing protein [Pontibacter litorisediminis]